VPAFNNLSLALMVDGRTGEAVDAARSALELDPANVHALSNLVHFLVLQGREPEARETAARLAGAASPDPDAWIKKAEAYSRVGDDEAVLAACREAGLSHPLLLHYAAVAEMRLGREQEARRLWERAVDLAPSLPLAVLNLEDLAKPVGERHAPWAFDLRALVPREAVEDLVETTSRVGSRGTTRSMETAVRLVLERHPEIVRIAPALLDRGDPGAREFALMVASMARTPELVDALAGFALGRRGPDSMRISAANVAIEAGRLPRGQTRMWVRGEWNEILLFACEIYDEPVLEHSPRVNAWVSEGRDALVDEDYERARALFGRAAEAEPHVPTARFNLAATLGFEGREAEAVDSVEAIHREFPDYLFGRTYLAKHYARERRFDEAEALLAPLLERSRLHASEFAALCDAHVALEHAWKRREAARMWLSVWERAMPEHPGVDYWRERLYPPSPRDRRTR
jgi:tetratricopeptide (TPR) repeat protein